MNKGKESSKYDHNYSIGAVLVDTEFHRLSRNALDFTIGTLDLRDILIFSDRPEIWPAGVIFIPIEKISTKEGYNRIILEMLPMYVTSDYYLVIQYDGFALDSKKWRQEFLGFDYIGAHWPNYPFHSVGNGGFSLRSRELIISSMSLAPYRSTGEAEDVFICRTVRPLLESKFGLRFADVSIARLFAYESPGQPRDTFGFHGVLNLVCAYRGRLEKLFEGELEKLIKRKTEIFYGSLFLPLNERIEFLSRWSVMEERLRGKERA